MIIPHDRSTHKTERSTQCSEIPKIRQAMALLGEAVADNSTGDAQTEQMIPIAPAPLNLGIDGFESWCGVVGLDDEGTLYECPMGARRAIVGPQNLTPIQRQQIANAMIARWTAFASGLSPLPR